MLFNPLAYHAGGAPRERKPNGVTPDGPKQLSQATEFELPVATTTTAKPSSTTCESDLRQKSIPASAQTVESELRAAGQCPHTVVPRPAQGKGDFARSWDPTLHHGCRHPNGGSMLEPLDGMAPYVDSVDYCSVQELVLNASDEYVRQFDKLTDVPWWLAALTCQSQCNFKERKRLEHALDLRAEVRLGPVLLWRAAKPGVANSKAYTEARRRSLSRAADHVVRQYTETHNGKPDGLQLQAKGRFLKAAQNFTVPTPAEVAAVLGKKTTSNHPTAAAIRHLTVMKLRKIVVDSGHTCYDPSVSSHARDKGVAGDRDLHTVKDFSHKPHVLSGPTDVVTLVDHVAYEEGDLCKYSGHHIILWAPYYPKLAGQGVDSVYFATSERHFTEIIGCGTSGLGQAGATYKQQIMWGWNANDYTFIESEDRRSFTVYEIVTFPQPEVCKQVVFLCAKNTVHLPYPIVDQLTVSLKGHQLEDSGIKTLRPATNVKRVVASKRPGARDVLVMATGTADKPVFSFKYADDVSPDSSCEVSEQVGGLLNYIQTAGPRGQTIKEVQNQIRHFHKELYGDSAAIPSTAALAEFLKAGIEWSTLPNVCYYNRPRPVAPALEAEVVAQPSKTPDVSQHKITVSSSVGSAATPVPAGGDSSSVSSSTPTSPPVIGPEKKKPSSAKAITAFLEKLPVEPSKDVSALKEKWPHLRLLSEHSIESPALTKGGDPSLPSVSNGSAEPLANLGASPYGDDFSAENAKATLIGPDITPSSYNPGVIVNGPGMRQAYKETRMDAFKNVTKPSDSFVKIMSFTVRHFMLNLTRETGIEKGTMHLPTAGEVEESRNRRLQRMRRTAAHLSGETREKPAEIQMKNEVVHKTKKPRGINSLPYDLSVDSGRVGKLLKDLCKNASWFIPGSTPAEIAESLRECSELGERNANMSSQPDMKTLWAEEWGEVSGLMAGDFVAMDETFSQHIVNLTRIVVKYFVIASDEEETLRIWDSLFKIPARIQTVDGSPPDVVSTGWKNCSGAGTTTELNTITAAMRRMLTSTIALVCRHLVKDPATAGLLSDSRFGGSSTDATDFGHAGMVAELKASLDALNFTTFTKAIKETEKDGMLDLRGALGEGGAGTKIARLAYDCTGPKFGDDSVDPGLPFVPDAVYRMVVDYVNRSDGMTIEMDFVKTTVGQVEPVEFLSRVYPSPGTSPTSYAKILRACAKLSVNINGDPMRAELKMRGYMAVDSKTPVVREYIIALATINGFNLAPIDAEALATLYDVDRDMYYRTCCGPYPRNEESDELTYEALSNQLGFTGSELGEYCRILEKCKSWEEIEEMKLPSDSDAVQGDPQGTLRVASHLGYVRLSDVDKSQGLPPSSSSCDADLSPLRGGEAPDVD